MADKTTMISPITTKPAEPSSDFRLLLLLLLLPMRQSPEIAVDDRPARGALFGSVAPRGGRGGASQTEKQNKRPAHFRRRGFNGPACKRPTRTTCAKRPERRQGGADRLAPPCSNRALPRLGGAETRSQIRSERRSGGGGRQPPPDLNAPRVKLA